LRLCSEFTRGDRSRQVHAESSDEGEEALAGFPLGLAHRTARIEARTACLLRIDAALTTARLVTDALRVVNFVPDGPDRRDVACRLQKPARISPMVAAFTTTTVIFTGVSS
jgi:hypothetical protein